jgi:Concanavalin A-like lectin/glucanases superfamily
MKPLFTLALVALPAFAAFPNGYSYCKVVTTSHTMVSGASDLTNYPLTVILTDVDLKVTGSGGHVQNSNGYDIVFDDSTACSGAGTALSWELESYTSTTGAIVAHIKRATLSHTSDDYISMYYGNSGISTFQSTASAVWDTNYKGVWHSQNLSFIDSTTNANNGTNHGATATAGEVDGGAAFVSASSQYVDMGDPAAVDITGASTLSAWVNFTSLPAASVVLGRWNDADYGNAILQIGSALYSLVGFNAGSSTYVANVAFSSTSAWHHVVNVFIPSAGLYLYVDGELAASNTTGPPSAQSSGTTHFEFGAGKGVVDAYFLNGLLDEARLSNIARSADWIRTEYRNQSAPGTYISVGPRIAPEASGARVRHVVSGGA